jgi:hypothetical protein
MVRLLPWFLILLIVAGAWRRDIQGPKPAVRIRPPARDEFIPGTVEPCLHSAPESIVMVHRVEVKPTPEQKIAALEGQLREYEQKVDELRAALSKVLNGKNYERLLSEMLGNSRLNEALLEAQIEVLEAAYAEHMIQHRHPQ